MRALHPATIALLGLLAAVTAAADALRINGSSTVNPVAVDAASILRAESGLEIWIDTQGGSSGGIASIGHGSADIGMSSRPLTVRDRRRYPDADLKDVRVGDDALALVVSADVWHGGVRALAKAEVRAIYEGRIRNWREVGGPDLRVVFFDKEPGRGTWEVFARRPYGALEDAPDGRHRAVGGNAEARSKIASTRGAIGQLSVAWARATDGVFALAIRLDDGSVVTPTEAAARAGSYPLLRPLLLVTNGPPAGPARAFIDFILSERGQKLVRRHGYLPLVRHD